MIRLDKSVDLTNVSFDGFVRFIFDRNPSPGSTSVHDRHPWYFHADVTFGSETVCAHYVKLFLAPEFLVTRYTKAQLEEGFWAVQGPNLKCSAYSIIFESDATLSSRKECIRSMTQLFERLFVAEPLDTSVQMWWDSFCYDWQCGNRKRERGGDDMELQDVLFETLSRVLATESEICQAAALHGLGHLRHPLTRDLIDAFLREHSSLTPAQIEHARSAARFDIL